MRSVLVASLLLQVQGQVPTAEQVAAAHAAHVSEADNVTAAEEAEEAAAAEQAAQAEQAQEAQAAADKAKNEQMRKQYMSQYVPAAYRTFGNGNFSSQQGQGGQGDAFKDAYVSKYANGYMPDFDKYNQSNMTDADRAEVQKFFMDKWVPAAYRSAGGQGSGQGQTQSQGSDYSSYIPQSYRTYTSQGASSQPGQGPALRGAQDTVLAQQPSQQSGATQYGDYEKYLQQYAGQGQGGHGQGQSGYADYQKYLQQYAGQSQGGAGSASAGYGDYQKYLQQYAAQSQGGQGQGSGGYASYEKYMQQYAGQGQASHGKGTGGYGDYEKYMQQYAAQAQGGSDKKGYANYQQYMQQYTQQGQGQGQPGQSQQGYQKYMQQYAGQGGQGSDYQQYLKKYSSGQGKGNFSQYGDYEKYMSEYSGAGPTDAPTPTTSNLFPHPTPAASPELETAERAAPSAFSFWACLVAGFSLPAAMAFAKARRDAKLRDFEKESGFHLLA